MASVILLLPRTLASAAVWAKVDLHPVEPVVKKAEDLVQAFAVLGHPGGLHHRDPVGDGVGAAVHQLDPQAVPGLRVLLKEVVPGVAGGGVGHRAPGVDADDANGGVPLLPRLDDAGVVLGVVYPGGDRQLLAFGAELVKLLGADVVPLPVGLPQHRHGEGGLLHPLGKGGGKGDITGGIGDELDLFHKSSLLLRSVACTAPPVGACSRPAAAMIP